METVEYGDDDVGAGSLLTNVPLWHSMLVEGCACVGTGNSVLSTQFCCEPNIALKYQVYLF